MNRIWVPDVALEVYFYFIYILIYFFIFERVKLLLMHSAKAQCQAGDHFPFPASKKVFLGQCQPRIYFNSLATVARHNLGFSANMRTKYCKIQKNLHSHTYQYLKWFGKKTFFLFRLNSSYSYFVEFSATWQQCILERVQTQLGTQGCQRFVFL